MSNLRGRLVLALSIATPCRRWLLELSWRRHTSPILRRLRRQLIYEISSLLLSLGIHVELRVRRARQRFEAVVGSLDQILGAFQQLMRTVITRVQRQSPTQRLTRAQRIPTFEQHLAQIAIRLLQVWLSFDSRKQRSLRPNQIALQQMRAPLHQEQQRVLAIFRFRERDHTASVRVTPCVDQIFHQSVSVF